MISNTCYKYRIHNMTKLYIIGPNALQYSETGVKELKKVLK